MNRTTSSMFALIAVMGLGDTSVLAQSTPVAVLGVEAVDAPTNRAACLTELLKGQVKQAPGHSLAPGKDLDEIKLVFGCVDEKPACMSRAGKSLKAGKLIWGTLKKGPAGYVLSIKVLDVAASKVVNEVSEAIAKRALDDNCASDAVGSIARNIFATNKGSIKVSANISGAQVMLGPTVIGLTYDMPIVLKDLPPGQYKIVIRKDGYVTWDRLVTIKGGQVLEINATLQEIGKGPKPGPGDEGELKPSKGKLGWKIAFWSSAALTVGMATGLGVTGAGVLGVEKDKDDFILDYRQKMNNYHLLSDDQDVCGQTVKSSFQADLDKICDDGQGKAMLANVFLGLTLAAAAASGFFYYKAYMGKEAPAEPVQEDGSEVKMEKTDEVSVRWMLSPTAGPHGAGLGFQMNF